MKYKENTIKSKITWEWLGGFFDGEGYAGFHSVSTYMYYKKRKDGTRTIKPYICKPRIDINIAQKDTRILKRIKKFLGYGYVGKIQWQCNSTIGRNFLKTILPYLKTPHKRQQVIKILKLDKKNIKPRKG